MTTIASGTCIEDRAEPQLAFALSKLGCLAVGDVADDPDKDPLVSVPRLTDREIHRKYGAVLASADDFAADADDFFLPGAQVVREIAIVLARIRLGHQNVDVAPDQFCGACTRKAARSHG